MGAGHLYPAKLLAHDRKTPIPGSYHILNIGQTKEAFLDAHSPNARKPGYPGLTYKRLPVVPQDNDIVLRATALAGTDIWMDPMIRRAFFLSGRVVVALQAVKLAGKLKLTRCRVLHDN